MHFLTLKEPKIAAYLALTSGYHFYCYRENFDTKKRVLQLKKLKNDDASYGTEHHSKFKYYHPIWSSWDFSRLKFPGKPQGNQKVLMMRIAVLQFLWEKIGSNVHYNSGTKKKEVKSVEISWEMLKSLFDFHAISMTRIFYP